MNELSHISEDNRPAMVDVTNKSDLYRVAKAKGEISLQKDTIKLISENKIKKGNVLTTAELAGVMAAKKTSELIPLCHPLAITKADVKLSINSTRIIAEATIICVGKTGVEMEALTAVNIALLTVYDMCKAVDKQMIINNIVLVKKTKKAGPQNG